MRVNDTIEIINANLLNQPEISAFGNITTSLQRVSNGSLFIANNNHDAQEAINQGAYGIIFEDEQIQITQNECAWIKVDSLEDAITRLIRYLILSNNLTIIYLKKIEFEIAKEIITDPRVALLQGGYTEFLECVQNQGVQTIITNNTKLLKIPLEHLEGMIPEHEPFKVISCTLFDSKIYFDSKRYTLSLASIFLPYLASVLTLFENEKIFFSLGHFESIPYFKPIFINHKGFACPYGQSGRVLLAEEQNKHFKYYADYVTQNAKWARISFFVPKEQEDSFPQAICYDDPQKLPALLEKYPFNFALILGISSEFLEEILPVLDEEIGLFDA